MPKIRLMFRLPPCAGPVRPRRWYSGRDFEGADHLRVEDAGVRIGAGLGERHRERVAGKQRAGRVEPALAVPLPGVEGQRLAVPGLAEAPRFEVEVPADELPRLWIPLDASRVGDREDREVLGHVEADGVQRTVDGPRDLLVRLDAQLPREELVDDDRRLVVGGAAGQGQRDLDHLLARGALEALTDGVADLAFVGVADALQRSLRVGVELLAVLAGHLRLRRHRRSLPDA